MKYKGISYEKHNERYIIRLNKDLIDLGLRTEKNLQQGHKGYKKESTLQKTVDKRLKVFGVPNKL